MKNNIRRLGRLFLLGFATIALGLAYWQLIRAPELLARDDNPRHLEAERQLRRGQILDRDGRVLAETVMAGGEAQRHYPYPPLAPVIGYYSLRHGTANIERAYDDHLRGENTAADAWTTLRRELHHQPQIGDDVVLTIDLALQRAADEILGDVHGALVLLDPRTGEILALASHPYYDPNTLDENWSSLRDDPDTPLLNRATQGRYPPGSVFKTVTLAAALEEGLVAPNDTFDDGEGELVVDGFPIECRNNPPDVMSFDLAHAFAYSCNLTFARLGLDLGTRRFKEYAGQFGVGEAIPLEIPVVASQLANDPLVIDRVQLATTTFGQGELAVTPLQMALITAGVANDGAMPQPRLVLHTQSHGGIVMSKTSAEVWHRPISVETAQHIRKMMVTAVEDGWAYNAAIPGVEVGGKTGTAQLDGDVEPHAWFIALAPADAPRFAVAVVVEHGGRASQVAAPMAREILKAALDEARNSP